MKKVLIFIKSHFYNYWIATLALAMTNCKNTFCDTSLRGTLSDEAIQKKSIVKQKAFTLAEIMIVLSVIAVLTAILLPAARNATPNEDLMKFKKGHLALVNVIGELVNSDKYYYEGMLDTKPNGQWVDSPTYFCETFADVIGNVKSVDCKSILATGGHAGVGVHINAQWLYTTGDNIYAISHPDSMCKKHALNQGNEIVLSNNMSYYMLDSGNHFGSNLYDVPGLHFRAYNLNSYTGFPFYSLYKIFCMDIDGTPENATETDCVNECPFGYGIRVDGKVLIGKRASEWFKKTIQDKD